MLGVREIDDVTYVWLANAQKNGTTEEPHDAHLADLATDTSHGVRLHENGSLDRRFNLLCGGFGLLLRFVLKPDERLAPVGGDVEPVPVSAGHDVSDLPHIAAPYGRAMPRLRLCSSPKAPERPHQRLSERQHEGWRCER